MGVEVGDRVTIHYRGQFDDGQEFDSSYSREPIEFDVGQSQVIEAIDAGVVGLEPGEERSIIVEPENGYGERRDDLVRTVPENLMGEYEVSPGDAVEIETDDGQTFVAEVLSINADEQSLTLDLNHPLAGRRLEFIVTLLSIRKAAA